jgi:hypothetical protein
MYIYICMYIVHICNYRLFFETFWCLCSVIAGVAISQAEMLTWWLMDHLKQDHTQPVRGLFIVWFCWQNRDGFDLALKSLNDGFMSQESIFLFFSIHTGNCMEDWQLQWLSIWVYGSKEKSRRLQHMGFQFSTLEPCHVWATYLPNRTYIYM